MIKKKSGFDILWLCEYGSICLNKLSYSNGLMFRLRLVHLRHGVLGALY